MRTQVKRMVYLGAGQALGEARDGVVRALGKWLPVPTLLPTAAFVVSHNYGPFPNANVRNCNSRVHTAPNGMSNLDQIDEGGTRSLLDQKAGEANDWMRCFDTAPFRDTDDHTRSLYQRIFEARGPYFMGCKNAQADDPTSLGGTAAARPADAGPGARRVPCQ